MTAGWSRWHAFHHRRATSRRDVVEKAELLVVPTSINSWFLRFFQWTKIWEITIFAQKKWEITISNGKTLESHHGKRLWWKKYGKPMALGVLWWFYGGSMVVLCEFMGFNIW